MKPKSEFKNAFVVLVSGIAAVLLGVYFFSLSQRPVIELAEANAFEIMLRKADVLTSEITHDQVKVQELTRQVEHLNRDIELFSEQDFFVPTQALLGKLTGEVDHIALLYSQVESQLVNAPDSTQAKMKLAYADMILGSKERISESIDEIESSMENFKNVLFVKTQKARYYQYAGIFIMSAVFIGFAFMTYQKTRVFEDFKHVSEEKFGKETTRMETMSHFVEAIAEGRYSENIEFEKGDHLAERMVEMKNKLLLSAETDRKRNWATQGMAEIGALLRDVSTIEKLYSNITKFCVKYTGSNQASLFVLNEETQETPYLEMVSAYAYDKQKFLQKRIALGEGLVGQAVLEGHTINMTKLPQNYIHITSGLGDAPPNALIIVPLKLNEKVYGIIEMASFRPYEAFEIDFMEKLGESVASSISAARINDKTKILLEKSQQQMEELRAQEEEVRQNMEELSATQEQMARQMEETKKLSDNLQIRENVFALTTILSEADLFGTITEANDKLVEVSKYTRSELIGKPHSIFRHPDMPKDMFKLFWDTIKQGKVFRGIIKNRAKDGTHYWVDATIVPVQDTTGKTVKYIGARYHITDDGFAEHLYNLQAVKLKLPPLAQHEKAA